MQVRFIVIAQLKYPTIVPQKFKLKFIWNFQSSDDDGWHVKMIFSRVKLWSRAFRAAAVREKKKLWRVTFSRVCQGVSVCIGQEFK